MTRDVATRYILTGNVAADLADPPVDHSPGPDAGPGRRRLDRLEAATFVAVAIAVGWLGWRRRWTADDAFINFRVVDNLLAGEGPVYNAGERVEVATSTLWLAIITAAEAAVPGDAVAWSSVLLGLACTVAGVVLAMLGARGLVRGTNPWLTVPFGAVVLLALPPFWDFSTSGLETGLSFAWIGGSFAGLTRLSRTPTPAPATVCAVAFVLGLGPLVRPDLAIVSLLLIAWLVVAVPGTWMHRGLRLLAAGLLPVAVQVLRMGYYGLLVPNTAVAKESGRAVWDRGLAYAVDLVAPHALWIPALLAVAALVMMAVDARWSRPQWSLVAVVLVAGLAHAAFVVRVGGDFMHARLLLPSLFLLLCPVMVVAVPRARRRAAPVAVTGIALLAWAAVSALLLRLPYDGFISDSGITDERGYWATLAGHGNPVTLEDHGGTSGVLAYSRQVTSLSTGGADVIAQQPLAAPPGTPVTVIAPSSGGVVFAVGNAGFYGVGPGPAVRVVDGLGLTDPVGSHLEAGPPTRAGHEKPLPAVWLLARYGAADLALGATTSLPSPGELAAARETLSCGGVARLLEATSAPLTWDRFLSNVTSAAELTSIRIPSDPVQARRQLC